MRLLVFGKNGQVARALQVLAPEAVFLGREEADLGVPELAAEAIATHAPDAVINAAAYTAVDRAEQEEPLAARINGAAPTIMAEACADLGIPLVHISSDYVFDGAGSTPFAPSDRTVPQNAYGWTKLAGEQGIQAAKGSYGILRTSWVFSAYGANFVKTMLRLGGERDSLSVVADQIGGPTPAADIAAACLGMAEALAQDPSKRGIYHFSGTPETSWAEFAREIFEQAGLDCQVEDIASEAYPTPAKRPLNSRLDCSSFEKVFGLPRPDWKAGLAAVLRDLA